MRIIFGFRSLTTIYTCTWVAILFNIWWHITGYLMIAFSLFFVPIHSHGFPSIRLTFFLCLCMNWWKIAEKHLSQPIWIHKYVCVCTVYRTNMCKWLKTNETASGNVRCSIEVRDKWINTIALYRRDVVDI